jgi:hypothetical protein
LPPELGSAGASPGILSLVVWTGRRWGEECHQYFGIGGPELGPCLNEYRGRKLW